MSIKNTFKSFQGNNEVLWTYLAMPSWIVTSASRSKRTEPSATSVDRFKGQFLCIYATSVDLFRSQFFTVFILRLWLCFLLFSTTVGILIPKAWIYLNIGKIVRFSDDFQKYKPILK